MIDWLNIFKHLLPRSQAWRLTIEKLLKKFFRGLGVSLGEDTKKYLDDIYQDLDPEKTRCLSIFEKQFNLPNSGLTEQERRSRLADEWKTLGGQDPDYIQGRLRGAGFDVYVHEWWEPTPGRSGGSVNGDVSPVVKAPLTYLRDGGSQQNYTMFDGGEDAFDGGEIAEDGGITDAPGYVLVNKILIAVSAVIGDGSEDMFDGGQNAQDGGSEVDFKLKEYIIPTDPDKWPYFLYIGGENFPDQATIQSSRRDEFERLCLKICPTEQWLGILANYS